MNVKRWTHLAGSLIAVIALAYVGIRLWDDVFETNTGEISDELLITSVAGSFVYVAACLLLVEAWRRLILVVDKTSLPFSGAALVYAPSQIAKYIPGNVLHIAARHAIGRSINLSHGALAFAAVFEILGLVFAASALGTLMASVAGSHTSRWITLGILAAAVIFLVALPGIQDGLKRRYPSVRTRLSLRVLRRALIAVLLLYVCFFVLSGAVLALMVLVVKGASDLRTVAASFLIFAVAWSAGFLTPGAPAGIGVREAIMVVALEHLGLGPQSVVIALLFRVTTTVGDVFFFFLCFGIGREELRQLRNSRGTADNSR